MIFDYTNPLRYPLRHIKPRGHLTQALWWAVAGMIFYGTYKCSGKMKMEKESEVVECMALSFYTMTNLENTKAARFFKKLSTYFSSTFLLGTRVVLKLKKKLNSKFWQDLSDFSLSLISTLSSIDYSIVWWWYQWYLVLWTRKNIRNWWIWWIWFLIKTSFWVYWTIGIGLLSLILDWIYARVGWESLFHNNFSRTGSQSMSDQGQMENVISQSVRSITDQRSEVTK